ncbi:hypothetical protein ACJMK2_024955 [Sinanodonta woodiana]|uniref:HAT C-terminal dimerisation domain-containing protein n=1 Tax=Sinanodonta woodiana TaxID=1069815 RepID=A0ABD3XEZ8_SINWO
MMVESTRLKITQFKTKNGIELAKAYDELTKSRSLYHGVKLTDREQLSLQFLIDAKIYLDKFIENLDARFNEQSMKNLQLLNTALNPSKVPQNANSLDDHGENELPELINIYGGDGGVINADLYQVKVVIKSLNCTLTEACTALLQEYRDIFPDFAVLASIVLVSPVTSVAFKEAGSSVLEYDPKKSIRKFCEIQHRQK